MVRSSAAAFHHHRLSKLGSEIAVRPELTEKGFAQGFGVFFAAGVGLLDLRGTALGRVSRHFHRGLVGEAEGHEEGRIVDVDRHGLATRIERRHERQGEMQREQALVVVERIVLRRLEGQIVRIADMHIGKIVEVLERVDVDLGQRLELLLGEDAVAVGIEPLHRHGGVELVEGPGMAHTGNSVLRVEEDFRAHRRPYMGMRVGRRREAKTGRDRKRCH
jgi:hypothetical protein